MNLLELIEKYKIVVPLIQRDYVQGSDIKKAKKFLEAIKSSKELNLDFIYGYIKDDCFIPIDGQQRLTTLFLIFLYVNDRFDEKMKKFNYELRGDAEDFLKELIQNKENLPKDDIKKYIINSNWFYESWMKNPTIKSMLSMLDLIENYFKEDSIEIFKKVKFSFLNLDETNQGEEIYVKLNARGKLLDDFENFKAELEKNIDDKEFSKKIDGEWLDFFWKKANTDANRVFYNFIKYLAEMIKYKNGLKEKFDYDDFDEIIKITSENRDFLKKSLDNLNLIDGFMKSFSESFEKEKIALFDKKYNLLDKVLFNIDKKEDAPSIFDKIILFTIIQYINKFNKVDNNLKNIIRSVRDILWQDKALRRGKVIFSQTLAYKDVTDYLKLFDKFLESDFYKALININSTYKKDAIEKEQGKAKLIIKNSSFKSIIEEFEDVNLLKGDISNFLTDDIDKLKRYLEAIKNLFINPNDSLLIRAMLTVDDYSIFVGYSYLKEEMKEKYYFGRNGYRDIILQAKRNEIFNFKTFWQNFLDKYLENRLEKMINDYLENIKKKDWKYYFIKYPEFTKEYAYEFISNDLNVFTWDENFNIEKLKKTQAKHHISPFIYTVGSKVKNVYAKSGKGGDEDSYLCFGRRCSNKINFIDGKWEIEINNSLPKNVINEFNIKKDDDEFILDTDDDKIEVMINFLEKI